MKKNIKKGVVCFLKSHLGKSVDTHHGQLKRFPDSIIMLVYIMCLNILFQGVLDIIVKFCGYTPWVTGFPWRIDFLFLTTISVLMGFQTFNAMKHQKLDVTRNSILLGFLVETALIVGDLHFISVYSSVVPEVVWFRAPFIVLTMFNIWVLSYVVYRLRIFTNRKVMYNKAPKFAPQQAAPRDVFSTRPLQRR